VLEGLAVNGYDVERLDVLGARLGLLAGDEHLVATQKGLKLLSNMTISKQTRRQKPVGRRGGARVGGTSTENSYELNNPNRFLSHDLPNCILLIWYDGTQERSRGQRYLGFAARRQAEVGQDAIETERLAAHYPRHSLSGKQLLCPSQVLKNNKKRRSSTSETQAEDRLTENANSLPAESATR